ncbi:Abhydrolase domain-containing protein 2-A [Acipenser ruthenus]|uniref:Monoacylglycerol lipase ABHD2 n=1 Tax=Acipenser ruthenus TaxID=7906 RepID=A0A444V7W7_ACIRT|nr:Abhydrolase domain-containing protein 2-A [Acipenser ruthenus]
MGASARAMLEVIALPLQGVVCRKRMSHEGRCPKTEKKMKGVAAAPEVKAASCCTNGNKTPSPRIFFLSNHSGRYIPPLLWGKCGHLQTALYGKMGRVSSPHPIGLRKFLAMHDGATATFDLFEPLADQCTGDDVTMVICPGIGNHSEKHYIRTFVDYAQKQGYRCAVLNHLGALPNIELTSPRMFTYGCTWEFAAMVGYIKKTFAQTQLIVVGFSLGGNIVCKFLGENHTNQERVLCCVSVCQGYSALRAQETFLQWDQCRRFYNFLMADNMKRIILSHRGMLFGESSNKRPRMMEDADLSRLFTATSLMQIDDNIMRKFHGYDSLKEYYEKDSCVHYIHNVNVPLLLVNTSDDPLVHPSLLTIPRTLAEKKENVIFALTLHGGHLGFFEGAVLFPQPLTWMDKVIVEYANTICQWEKHKPQCGSGSEQDCS